ncbi:MAG: hypothetical protein H7Y36_05150, partial [Armatimonadetes bacterium]|nr:hypothetical protein [Akkermansiaceae bacterium]
MLRSKLGLRSVAWILKTDTTRKASEQLRTNTSTADDGLEGLPKEAIIKRDKCMLQSVKHVFGDKLRASDGEIGRLKDFYFDDQNWTVRYVVADTGSWLPGRQVLISPRAFGGLYQAGNVLDVNLNRKQIEESPSIQSHKPVSRQYEEVYHRYYGWPYYWQGDAFSGLAGSPILEAAATPLPMVQALVSANYGEGADAHLRSLKDMVGFKVQASDGMIGHVCDFLMDSQSLAIRQLVIKGDGTFSG